MRRWRSADLAPFAERNRDPEVVEFLPGPLTRHESDAMVERIEAQFEARGFGLWALESRETGAFLGFVGLLVPRFDAHFTPAVEIGWRLAREAWGRGYASEAAREALAFGFERAVLDEIVSFTVPANERSQRVMQRIGLRRDPADDFDHPGLADGHPLQRHRLYRLTVEQWRSQRTES